MRNLGYLLLIAIVFIQSCSTMDDVLDEPQPEILITKIERAYNSSIRTTRVFTYEGNKLLHVKHNLGNVIDYYTYEGNLITGIKSYNNGNLYVEVDYFYDRQNRLIKNKKIAYEAVYGNEWASILDFEYNSDNTISFLKRAGTGFSDLTYDTSGIIHKNENSLIDSLVYSDPNNHRRIYTYDQKNSPFKNILGMDKLLIESNLSSNLYGSNNMTSYTRISEIDTLTLIYSHEYNSSNYAISSRRHPTGAYQESLLLYTYNQ